MACAVAPNNDFGGSNGTDFIGGGQIGCDYQFASNWVIGIQGMYDYGRVGSTHFIRPLSRAFRSVRLIRSTR